VVSAIALGTAVERGGTMITPQDGARRHQLKRLLVICIIANPNGETCPAPQGSALLSGP
jgi:hypothetical protein